MLPLRCRFLRRRAKLVQVQLSSRWRRQGLRVPLHRAPRRAGPRRHPPVCALHARRRDHPNHLPAPPICVGRQARPWLPPRGHHVHPLDRRRLQLHQEPLQPGLRNSRPHAAPPRCEPPIRRCLSSLQPPSSTGGRFQQRIAAAAWHAGFSVRASAAAALRTLSQPPLLPFSSPPLPLNRPLRRWMAC
jgi:hypothetical protein